mmetsp:Transcript_685/g.745  ORF Transcript_685/g.745 Transcript_685/m.745 type:complete len:202 (-) Transcript_685:356-961(-)
MAIDLVDQSLWQGLVVCEPCQQCHPIVEFSPFIFSSHLFIVVRDDLYETAHDVGKEGNPQQHNDDSEAHLERADWVEVSIAHSREGSQGKVTADDKPIIVRVESLIVQVIVSDKGIRILDVIISVPGKRDQVPKAPHKVGYDNGYDDESKDPIGVHKDVLCHNPVLSLTTLEEVLDKFIELAKVEEANEFGESEQSEQSRP